MKNAKSAFEAGLKLLRYGDKSANELWRRLSEKGFSADEVNEAVTKLKEYRYVDDLSLALRYVERHKNKKRREQLLYELINKGIEDSTALQALQDIDDEE